MNSDDTKRFKWNVLENWPNALFMDDVFESAKMVQIQWKKSPPLAHIQFGHGKRAYKMFHIKSINLYAMIRSTTHAQRACTLVKWIQCDMIWKITLHKSHDKIIQKHNSYCYQHDAWHLFGFQAEQEEIEKEENRRSINTARTHWLCSKNRLSCLDACEICFTHTKSIFCFFFRHTKTSNGDYNICHYFNVSLYSLILYS